MAKQTSINQILYALERAAEAMEAAEDKLMSARDYSAEFAGEGARHIREAMALLRVGYKWSLTTPTEEGAYWCVVQLGVKRESPIMVRLKRAHHRADVLLVSSELVSNPMSVEEFVEIWSHGNKKALWMGPLPVPALPTEDPVVTVPEVVNACGPAHLAPKPAPGLAFDDKGVLRRRPQDDEAFDAEDQD